MRTPRDTTKDKAIAAAIAAIEKDCGKGAIMRLGDAPQHAVEVIPTGILPLDAALGVGGIPRGRITEIYGSESSSKTSICLSAIGNAQAAGGVAAFIDAEHALDVEWAKKLGVDTDALLTMQPDNGEQALEAVEKLVRSDSIDIIVVDSVSALVPRAEIEGDMGDSHVGLQARLMSQALRKLTSPVARSKTALVFINQLREKVGVMFGSPEITSGGKALKFYASLRLDARRVGPVKDKDEVVGSEIRVKAVKNKMAAPFRQASFNLVFGEGFDKVGLVLDWAVDAKLIDKSGAWYAMDGAKIGQGRENARLWLRDNPEVLARLETAARAALMPGAK